MALYPHTAHTACVLGRGRCSGVGHEGGHVGDSHMPLVGGPKTAAPIGEGTAVAAGRLWKTGNIVHFHEKCHKIH